jgi:hypothetical protein
MQALIKKRLYPMMLAVVVLAATLTASELFADKLIEIDQKYKEGVVRLFQPGTLLVWSCPTCSYTDAVNTIQNCAQTAVDAG